ncbi:MAG: hypothetical protein BWZ07_02031 [Alphaproteobacteria bacterium ADurb.BinA280]|nr:MAG: hypothetical protein BWZ07_02031 [Alphaproteobacteria bacterium ADurb.BinA280]
MKFLPDAPRDTPEVLTEVEAVPTVRGYAGSPTVINGGYAALAAACNGAALIFKLDGSMRIFAGTQSKLYEGSGGTWTDRSRAGSYTTGDIRWCFAQFGDTTLAINKATVLQSSTSGAFADVANAPKAACMETVGGFVVLGNTDDTGLAITGGPNADQGNRWWCSQLFNATGTWAPSAATQATSGLLVSSPGKIIAMKRLGDQVIAYKNRAIHVGQYVGPPDVFDWQLVPGEIGTWSNEAVVSTGTAHLFIGYENVYRFDGSRPVAIGDGIREWFFARLNKQYAYLIAGIHDRNTSTVWWWYPSGSSTTLDSVLVYNYAADRWGHATDATLGAAVTVYPVQTIQAQITYDNLYTSLGISNPQYDQMPNISYDSPFWQASAPVMAVIRDDKVLYTLTGSASDSSITTGYWGDQERYSFCDRVRAKYRTKPTDSTLTPYAVTELGADVATGSATLNVDRYDVLQSARWHKFKLEFVGPVEVEAVTPRLKTQGYE